MISVIIPAYNEEACIGRTIRTLMENDQDGLIREVIISDGGSSDATQSISEQEGAKVVRNPVRGRSAQMNYGASLAKGHILYFLHADTIPPFNFTKDITRAIENGFTAGCFMLSFDHPHWFLRANCWFTRFNINSVRFGDQSLFVEKRVFYQSGGFCENHFLLEDQEIIKRLKAFGRFKVIPRAVLTSARRYLQNGIFKTQRVFYTIYLLYRLGMPQKKLQALYLNLIKQ